MKLIKIIFVIVLLALLLFIGLVAWVYFNQGKLVQNALSSLNKDFKGEIVVERSHIEFLENFPYISIDLQGLTIFEDKDPTKVAIAKVSDAYVGFSIWPLLRGNIIIKKIKFVNGALNLVTYQDGSLNLANALASPTDLEAEPDSSSGPKVSLKEVTLNNISLHKTNVASNTLVDAEIDNMRAVFKADDQQIFINFDTKCLLNLIVDNDTTFLKQKQLNIQTGFLYQKQSQILSIDSTEVMIEGASFGAVGSIDFLNDVALDLHFFGDKPNFDLVFALVPDDVKPALARYENQGRIFFDAKILGKSINGHKPLITANFGAENAFFNNQDVQKKVDKLQFKGSFTNGDARDKSSMQLIIDDFEAKPEAGNFTGRLKVTNFDSPDIDLRLNADFELEFLAKFFNLKDYDDLKGKVNLVMNFRDIIDLKNPEKSIERLDESYFTQLRIDDLSFEKTSSGIPIKHVSVYAEMNGHQAQLKKCSLQIGNSNISLKGYVSDLPAIIHHSKLPVEAKFELNAPKIDLFELTGSDSLNSVNEILHGLKGVLAFNASAKDILESPYLPIGVFKIRNMYVKPERYAHTLHDFSADVYIDKEDFKIFDLRGIIDQSDFHFSGKLKHYDLWFKEKPVGDTYIEFDLDSKMIKLADLLAYNGQNYLPEEYRNEEFSNIQLKGKTAIHFKDSLHSFDLYLNNLNAKLKMHPLALEQFKGQVHFENKHLQINSFSGKMGDSDFYTTMHYYFGNNPEAKKRPNKLTWRSDKLNLDQLLVAEPKLDDTGKVNHDAGFNIYELPFSDMRFDVAIKDFLYGQYQMANIKSVLRTTKNHFLYIDTLSMETAGGNIKLKGYFDGSDSQKIYFNPHLQFNDIDLDKFMVKFDNFGQDHLVSDQLHGRVTGNLTGKLRMHVDLVPIINESTIKITATIVDGMLENYPMFDYMADYFKNRNLSKVRFDTLSNTITIAKGVMQIPRMTINSTLGFIEIGGRHSLDQKFDYQVRIPWQLIRQAATSKLFGKKDNEIDPEQEDAIAAIDPNRKIRFINLRVSGTTDDFKIQLGNRKQ